MKQKDAEKNLWEIWEIDVDILLGRDEEKWQKEVEEFEKLAKDKGEDTTKKRLKEAQENIMDVEIDKERENSKSERERIDKLIKSTKTDKTVRWSVKKFTSDIITPVSTKIKEISPKIYREVMRYFQNKTQSEVAATLGLSQVQVSRLEKKLLNIMRNNIDNKSN